MCSRVNIRSGKCLVREMSSRGNSHSGKCQVGELSSRGCVSRGSVRRGNVQSGKCPIFWVILSTWRIFCGFIFAEWRKIEILQRQIFVDSLKNCKASKISSHKIPSRQILVPRTSRGSPPPTSPGGPLKILFDRPDLTSRGRPNPTFKGRLWEVDSGRPQYVFRTSPRRPSEYSNLDVPKFFLTFLSEVIRLTKSI